MLGENEINGFLEKLKAIRVTGPGTGHDRFFNLKVVDEIKQGMTKSLLGLEELQDLPSEQILAAIADITGCSKSAEYTEGPGYINPNATLAGLVAAAKLIVKVCEKPGNVILATGHPGSMIGFYLELAKIIRELGGIVITPGRGYELSTYRCTGCGLHDTTEVLDYVGETAVISTGEIVLHTHDCKPMEVILTAARQDKQAVDLVIADHGFAGYAIKSGLAVIAIMDTNDPAIAASKLLGYQPTIIPMDDNRPNYISAQVAQMLGHISKCMNE